MCSPNQPPNNRLYATWRSAPCGRAFRGGAILIAERLLVAPLALGLPLSLRPFVLGRVVGEIVFYFGLVGVVEELLFRGLVYQILDRWRGPGLAILGSALGFVLWHIGWMGPLILAPFLIGIVFGLVH